METTDKRTSMIAMVLDMLKGSPELRIFLVGSLITSLGSALTRIAIYGKLAQFGAPPLMFGVSYALSIVPSLFAAGIGLHVLRRAGPTRALVVSEGLGLIGVAVPWLGVIYHSISLLVIGSLIPGIAAGIAVAAYSAVIKGLVKEDHYASFSAIDALSFSASTVVGTSIAALMYSAIPVRWYFISDAASYLIAGVIFYYLGRVASEAIFSREERESTTGRAGRMPRLRGTRLRAFLLLPLMAATNGAAIALLPALGEHFSVMRFWAPLVIDPTVILVLARTVGQSAGPFIFRPARIDAFFMSGKALLTFVGMYLGLYAIAFGVRPSEGSFIAVVLAVVLAHVASNVVYVVGNTAAFGCFTKSEMPVVSVRANQVTITILAVVSIVAGKLANITSLFISFLAVSIPGFILYSIIIMNVGRGGDCLDGPRRLSL